MVHSIAVVLARSRIIMADLDSRAQNNMVLIMIIHFLFTGILGFYGTASFILRCSDLFQLDEAQNISNNVIKISQTIPSTVVSIPKIFLMLTNKAYSFL
jgi:hypothetical protein